MGINFQNVNFTYSKITKKALKLNKIKYHLKNINLEIKEKEIICILGHTGSGKSTLVQLANGLNRPSSGKVIVYDKTIETNNNVSLKEVRKKVGLVFQFPEYQLFEVDCLKDIMFGPLNFGYSKQEAYNNAIEASKLFNLDEKILSRSPFMLSGGQKRKVALCGVIASKPEVIILDEPTVGLDPYTKNELLNLIKYYNENEGKTIVIVTHDMDVVSKLATRVIVLKKGDIIFDGDKHELFEKEDLTSTYNLDTPEITKVLKQLKNELNLDINPNQLTVLDAIKELEKLGESYE